jgi:hypothetical protein
MWDDNATSKTLEELRTVVTGCIKINLSLWGERIVTTFEFTVPILSKFRLLQILFRPSVQPELVYFVEFGIYL